MLDIHLSLLKYFRLYLVWLEPEEINFFAYKTMEKGFPCSSVSQNNYTLNLLSFPHIASAMCLLFCHIVCELIVIFLFSPFFINPPLRRKVKSVHAGHTQHTPLLQMVLQFVQNLQQCSVSCWNCSAYCFTRYFSFLPKNMKQANF